MRTAKFHRLVGLLLLLPLLGWIVTGFIFFIKPGYAGAYENLQVKTYPLTKTLNVTPQANWRQIKQIKTVLGEHLLIRTENEWLHLDPASLEERPFPDKEEISSLLSDAFESNAERYGHITEIEKHRITTSTDVSIDLNWSRLTLSQRGADTRLIDSLYRVHYLQWTGIRGFDRLLGMLGLALLLILAMAGIRLALTPGRSIK